MEKRLMPEVLGRFFAAGMDIVACKMAKLKEQTLETHYAHIVGKPYYPPLVEFMQRRPCAHCNAIPGKSSVANSAKTPHLATG